MMRLWRSGDDTDPGIDISNRIEFHSPEGHTYIAREFGSEELFGKWVQRGISARVLEWANTLLMKAYESDPALDGPDNDGKNGPDWVVPKRVNGRPVVKFDPEMTALSVNEEGYLVPGVTPNCTSETDSSGCTCETNRSCMALRLYEPFIEYMWQLMVTFGWDHPGFR